MGISEVAEQTLERATIERNRRSVLSLNDRHAGETMFVLGSSPQLNLLSPPQIELLSRAPAIGLNRTQYRVPAMYFLGSHYEEVGLAIRVGAASAVIHMAGGRPAIPGTLAVWKRFYEDDRGLPRRFYGDRLILYNKRNAALAATHLALIMGARRIVYIGLEQRTNLRFFDEDPALRERIISDLAWVWQNGYHQEDRNLTWERHAAILRRPKEELAAEPYWHTDHTSTFEAYFAELERYGVEPIATLQNSVVYAAGARYVPLDEALERWAAPARHPKRGRLSGALQRASGALR